MQVNMVNSQAVPAARMFLTTTLAVVMFTVFAQASQILFLLLLILSHFVVFVLFIIFLALWRVNENVKKQLSYNYQLNNSQFQGYEFLI